MAGVLSEEVSLHYLSSLRAELAVLLAREPAAFAEHQAE